MKLIDKIVEKENKYLLSLEECEGNNYKTYLWGDGEGADNAQKRSQGFAFAGRLVNRKYYKIKENVYCLEDFLESLEGKINIVVACKNPDTKIIKTYEEKIENILIYDCYSGNFAVDPSLMTYEFVLENLGKLQLVYEQLEDDYSRQCLAAYINQKISMDYKYLKPLRTIPQYFEEFVELDENEVFVDAGAFDGDSALSFIETLSKRNIEKYNKIISFEPDPINYQKLVDRKLINHICYNLGLADKKGSITFEILGTSSVFNEAGDISVAVDTLDDIVDEKVSFIKMDIEGFELAALKGGSELIRRYRPKLAICIYHKKEDLWEIQEYIKTIVPEYRFYIRAHEESAIELVLYAVI